MSKLAPWKTVKSAYAFVLGHQKEFWRLARPPMAIICVAYAVTFLWFETEPESLASGLPDLLSLLVVPFLVAWHRLVLIGPQAVTGHHGLPFGPLPIKWPYRDLHFELAWQVVVHPKICVS